MGTYNKLVRDLIPAIILANGEQPVTHVLDDSAYRKALLDKLIEEATELRDSDGSLDERADVAEVLRALDGVLNITTADIEDARVQKAQKRGGFNARVWLDGIEGEAA